MNLHLSIFDLINHFSVEIKNFFETSETEVKWLVCFQRGEKDAAREIDIFLMN